MRTDRLKRNRQSQSQARGTGSAFALATAILLAACNGQAEQPAKPAKTVTASQPQQAAVTRYLYQSGTTKALESVDLAARVSGYLRSIDYRDGSAVKKGDRLFLIEPDPYEAKVQQAEAAVEQARVSLDNGQIQLARQQELMRSSTTTQTNVDNAKATRDEAQAQLNSAQGSLREAQINLGYTSITAPFDGFVTEHQADVGAVVGSGSPPALATIVKLDPIHVSFSISDTVALQIRQTLRDRGMTPKDLGEVTVEAATKIDQGFSHKGKLDYISPQTDAETGTLAVRAIFDNKDRDLLPNLFVRLRIALGTVKDALLVPPTAVGTDQQGRFVLIVNPDGVVERRSVVVLERSEGLQQVQGELSATDRVIANASVGVRAGETVKTQPGSPATETHNLPPAASAPATN